MLGNDIINSIISKIIQMDYSRKYVSLEIMKLHNYKSSLFSIQF